MEVPHRLGDQAELYVLGALTAAERTEFEAHLAVCASCAAEVRSLVPVLAALAQTATGAAPSLEVRRRLLTRLTGPRRFVQPPWLAAAASVAVAVVLGGYSAQLRGRVSTLETRLRDTTLRAESSERQIADVRRTAAETQSALAVLEAPDVARIDLAGQSVAPSASARAFWSRSRGLVFTASNLPPLPPGRTYQLWVITAQPAPISAGLLKPDANGRVSATFETPPDLPTPLAMAVTDEPEGGVPSPTGQKYLVSTAD